MFCYVSNADNRGVSNYKLAISCSLGKSCESGNISRRGINSSIHLFANSSVCSDLSSNDFEKQRQHYS